MSRFTFTATLDARVQRTFSIGRARWTAIADLYNATNLSNEINETVMSGPLFRTALDRRPPRMLHLGARLNF